MKLLNHARMCVKDGLTGGSPLQYRVQFKLLSISFDTCIQYLTHVFTFKCQCKLYQNKYQQESCLT